ncbi:MAG: YceI family protein [Bdellovibrionales bacterium]
MLDTGSHCVAYRARKRLLLLASVQVVGKSCQVSAQVTPEVGGKYRIEIGFPITSLQSGEPERDLDVAKLLGADMDPDLRFVTEALSLEQWQALMKKEKGEVAGELRFADKIKPLQASLVLLKGEQGVEVDGLIKTTFSALHLKPPVIAMGLFAKVRDELELHFHFLGSRTLGAETILSEDQLPTAEAPKEPSSDNKIE